MSARTEVHPALPTRFGAVIEANVWVAETTERRLLVRVNDGNGQLEWHANWPVRGKYWRFPDSAVDRRLRVVVWFDGVGADKGDGE